MSAPECTIVYAVYWPRIHVAKVGQTWHESRYRRFLATGAELVDTVRFPLDGAGGVFEQLTLEHLRSLYPRGFPTREEAVPYLTGRGGGYLETFAIPTREEFVQALREVNRP